jgi:hypothetical protein
MTDHLCINVDDSFTSRYGERDSKGCYSVVLGADSVEEGDTIINVTVDRLYVMRGYDADLSHLVFWTASGIDTTAAEYNGVGPVTDIVIHRTIGA